eukprot:6387679-Prymnesium_polylepis.2
MALAHRGAAAGSRPQPRLFWHPSFQGPSEARDPRAVLPPRAAPRHARVVERQDGGGSAYRGNPRTAARTRAVGGGAQSPV